MRTFKSFPLSWHLHDGNHSVLADFLHRLGNPLTDGIAVTEIVPTGQSFRPQPVWLTPSLQLRVQPPYRYVSKPLGLRRGCLTPSLNRLRQHGCRSSTIARTSLVFRGTSRTICAPIFSIASLRSSPSPQSRHPSMVGCRTPCPAPIRPAGPV